MGSRRPGRHAAGRRSRAGTELTACRRPLPPRGGAPTGKPVASGGCEGLRLSAGRPGRAWPCGDRAALRDDLDERRRRRRQRLPHGREAQQVVAWAEVPAAGTPGEGQLVDTSVAAHWNHSDDCARRGRAADDEEEPLCLREPERQPHRDAFLRTVWSCAQPVRAGGEGRLGLRAGPRRELVEDAAGLLPDDEADPPEGDEARRRRRWCSGAWVVVTTGGTTGLGAAAGAARRGHRGA